MYAEELMSCPVATCHVNDGLNIAAQLMWDYDCGAVPVVNDEGRLVGIITDRDVCMAAYTQGRSLDAILVNSAMGRHVVAAHKSATIGEIERLMAEHQIRRIPIIDDAGCPIGIISLNDLALESDAPDSRMKQGRQKVAHTLAAIGHPRHQTAA